MLKEQLGQWDLELSHHLLEGVGQARQAGMLWSLLIW